MKKLKNEKMKFLGSKKNKFQGNEISGFWMMRSEKRKRNFMGPKNLNSKFWYQQMTEIVDSFPVSCRININFNRNIYITFF